jgi:hypothetical protein
LIVRGKGDYYIGWPGYLDILRFRWVETPIDIEGINVFASVHD